MREMIRGFGGPQIHVGVSECRYLDRPARFPARHYRPGDVGPAPLLVFFHGGGWVIGDLDTHDALCRLTCRDAGIHVLSIDYRLAPEHPAPAALDDAYAAFRWAHEHAAELGAIPGKVAVGGDSAGGNLAAVVSQLARDDGGPHPSLQWLIYPRTDFTRATRSHDPVRRRLLADQAGHRLVHATNTWAVRCRADRSAGLAVAGRYLAGLPPALIARRLRPAARRGRAVRRGAARGRATSTYARWGR